MFDDGEYAFTYLSRSSVVSFGVEGVDRGADACGDRDVRGALPGSPLPCPPPLPRRRRRRLFGLVPLAGGLTCVSVAAWGC